MEAGLPADGGWRFAVQAAAGPSREGRGGDPSADRKRGPVVIGFWWTLYALAAACLIVYGLHATYLLHAAQKRGPAYVAGLERCRERSKLGRSCFPRVLVQLPVYNEARVVQRLVEAVAALDWPREALEIQLLDDSTDHTPELAGTAIERAAVQGVAVHHVRRTDRSGFKAGALAHGLRLSDAPYVAVFDADFVPPADFLRRALPLFEAGPRVACVQGRWEHMNRGQNLLTRAQGVAVDAHFFVQQLARASGAGLVNFNGSAGVWSRAAIDEAGGWSSSTLTEDLDLSFRAHIAGFQLVFDPTLAVPAELPPTLGAYKSQQRRWACGSIQCARRLLGPLWHSGLSTRAKLEATLHVGGYVVCLAMVALAVLLPLGFGHLALLGKAPNLWPLWAAVWVAALGPLRVALHGQRAANRRRGAVGGAIAAALLGLGASANNALAVLRGLLWPIREFVRTPKQGRAGRAGGPLPSTELAFSAFTGCATCLLAVHASAAFATYALFCCSGSLALSIYWWTWERRFERLS